MTRTQDFKIQSTLSTRHALFYISNSGCQVINFKFKTHFSSKVQQEPVDLLNLNGSEKMSRFCFNGESKSENILFTSLFWHCLVCFQISTILRRKWPTLTILKVILQVAFHFFLLSGFFQQYHIRVFRLKHNKVPILPKHAISVSYLWQRCVCPSCKIFFENVVLFVTSILWVRSVTELLILNCVVINRLGWLS